MRFSWEYASEVMNTVHLRSLVTIQIAVDEKSLYHSKSPDRVLSSKRLVSSMIAFPPGFYYSFVSY